MKICRFNGGKLGLVKEGVVWDVSQALSVLPQYFYPAPMHDALMKNLDKVIEAISELNLGELDKYDLGEVALLAPIANPTKMIGAPVNYLKHQEEGFADPEIHNNAHLAKIREIALFLKANSSLVGPSEGVKVRDKDRRNDHELELAVIIGKTANRVSVDDAMNYVGAYTIGLDMTVRGTEDRSFRKSIDTYSVLGPYFVTADEIDHPDQLDMTLTVNGEQKQSANTRDLVVGIPELISWASSFYTLHPGDVIFTGTPEGVGPVKAGDVIKATIEKIGSFEIGVSLA